MRVSGPRHPSFRAGVARLYLALTLAVSGGGCTLLVGSELVDKPAEGGGGQGGGDASTATQSSAAQSGSGNSSGNGTGSGTGGMMCKENTADCDGFLWDGCEAKLLTDPKNCGACKKVCQLGTKCEDGECE
jgi:hypothetical protein